IKPAGLGARDTLRMEAAMPLYGHELGEEINALSCGVDFAISLDKDKDERGEKFIGIEALQKTAAAGGPQRKLAGFFVDSKRSARQGMPIRQHGKELLAVGTAVEIDMGKGVLPATVAPMPFYKAAKK